jgi:hypothetical protein
MCWQGTDDDTSQLFSDALREGLKYLHWPRTLPVTFILFFIVRLFTASAYAFLLKI